MAAQTLLAGLIDDNDTSLTAGDHLGFAGASETNDLVLIDSEFILVGGGLGTSVWTILTRGYAGSTAAAHADGVTRHLAATYDGAFVRTFINGAQTNALAQTGTLLATGTLNAGQNGGQYAQGSLQECAWYIRGITPSEIAQHAAIARGA